MRKEGSKAFIPYKIKRTEVIERESKALKKKNEKKKKKKKKKQKQTLVTHQLEQAPLFETYSEQNPSEAKKNKKKLVAIK